MKKTKGDIDISVAEIHKVVKEVKNIRREANKTLAMLRNKADELSLLLPEVKKYKNVVDPEYLTRQLLSFDKWEDGANIIFRFNDLVQESVSVPAKLPAKYIELVGDWCRKQNQSYLALEFYKESMERDPGRISAKVEFYALQAEVVPKKRSDSLKVLEDIALSGKLKIGRIKRIFNVYVELDMNQKLASLATALTEVKQYKDNNESLATLYRNNALALKEDSEYVTNGAWKSINKALTLNPKDENILKLYASWLLERGNLNETIKQAKVLIDMDPRDESYYIILSDALRKAKEYKKAEDILKYALSKVKERNGRLKLIRKIRKLPNNDFGDILNQTSSPERQEGN